VGADTAIADVGSTMIKLLRDKMSDLVPQGSSIALISPVDAEAKDVRLALFLYGVMENAYMKNQEMSAIGPNQLQQPPLVLELYYLLTAYAPQQIPDASDMTLYEHRLLGRAMSIFYDNAVLSGSMLQAGLAGQDDVQRITMHPISLDDLTKLWTTFPNLQYKPSVSYMVTPVTIDSKLVTTTGRVVSRELDYQQIEEAP
jgi:hypothetical protein